jgi:hypothetical protein
MDSACSTNGHKRYWQGRQKERNHYGDQEVAAWAIIKQVLEREDEMVRTGSIWLRIGTSGGLLRTW